MSTVGLITEYNPFHKGHEYHIKKAKEVTGADYAVAIMNGSFVQRGAPAFVDKYTRTRMALAGGADLVFELPVYYGLSSAEDFAYGSVLMLQMLGFVDTLCFGSETGNLDLLTPYARLYHEEPKEYRDHLFSFLKNGLSFPAAREAAARKMLNTDLLADPASPNNLLGIEYLKALYTLNSNIKPFTIARKGHGYHELPDTFSASDDFCSASGIREQFIKNPEQLQYSIPKEAFTFLEKTLKHTGPVTADDFSFPIYYSLRENLGRLNEYKDISDELANRIENLLDQFESTSQFISLLQTKQYTTSRISRILFQVLCNVKKGTRPQPCLRLLGMNKNASHLLKGNLDIITNPAKAKEVPLQDFFATNLYNYAIFQKYHVHFENEYVHSTIVI